MRFWSTDRANGEDSDVKSLRVGICGFGGAGMAQAIEFERLPGCRIHAVYDPKPAGLERARQMCPQAEATDDLDAFLAAGLDAVSICSPNDRHADQIIRALEAGCHVICEKPLTDSLENCIRILDAERRAKGRVVAVQHQMRFIPLHLRVRQLIAEGALGRISYVEGYYVHNVTQRLNRHDNWVYETQPPPLLLSGCHFVDLIRWLLNDEVVDVIGMGNSLAFPECPDNDTSVVLLRFRSGIIGKVVTAFGAARPQDHSLRVLGSRRCIDNNMLLSRDGFEGFLTRPILRQHRGCGRSVRQRWRYFLTDMQQFAKPAIAHGVFSLLRRWVGGNPAYGMNAYPMRLYEHHYAVRACLADFVDCIRSGRRPRATAADAACTVAACLAGVDAYRSGTPVTPAAFAIDAGVDRSIGGELRAGAGAANEDGPAHASTGETGLKASCAR